MSESERPRPEYGEYASGDEQAAALVRSGALTTPGQRSDDPLAPAASHREPPAGALEGYSVQSVADRLVTVFLISFWAIFVLGDAVSFLNLGVALRAPLKQIGVENYQTTALTAAIGIAMLVSQVVLWALAAVWSFRRLSSKKTSWWVPVILGVLGFIVVAILLGTLLITDPSVAPALTTV